VDLARWCTGSCKREDAAMPTSIPLLDINFTEQASGNGGV